MRAKEMHFVDITDMFQVYTYSCEINDYATSMFEKYDKGVSFIITGPGQNNNYTTISGLMDYDFYVMQEIKPDMIEMIFSQYNWGYAQDCIGEKCYFIFDNEFDAVFGRLMT